MSKLIVLRANSGSGKSTIATLLHAAIKNSVIIEQDYYIKYSAAAKTESQELARRARIFTDVNAALAAHDTVILEGVFDSRRYTDNFNDLLVAHPENNYFFYINVSFEETLRRHQQRDKRHKFGEKEMRDWYIAQDAFHYPFETIIDEQLSIDATVAYILRTVR
jgi:thymidylate kinase